MPMSLRGHLDMVRVLPRIFRRAGLSLYYTQGFSPRPVMTFGPALSLGTQSLAEYLDFALTKDHSAAELLSALKSATEEGLEFLELRRLIDSDPAVTKCIDEVGYSVRLEGTETDHNARLKTFLEAKTFPVEVTRKGKKR